MPNTTSFLKPYQDKTLSGLLGAGQILNNYQSARNINYNIPEYDYRLDLLSSVGRSPYSTFEDIDNAYSVSNYIPNVSFDDIRGMNTMQKIGNVGSSALSGASAGFALAGLPGAIGGLVFGLGAGIKGVLDGDEEARRREDFYNTSLRQEYADSRKNLSASSERLMNYNFRNGVSTMRASGGQIKREQNLQDFAERILRKPSFDTGRIIRKHCDGGTMVRIKR